jgi:hypothetical protein
MGELKIETGWKHPTKWDQLIEGAEVLCRWAANDKNGLLIEVQRKGVIESFSKTKKSCVIALDKGMPDDPEYYKSRFELEKLQQIWIREQPKKRLKGAEHGKYTGFQA